MLSVWSLPEERVFPPPPRNVEYSHAEMLMYRFSISQLREKACNITLTGLQKDAVVVPQIPPI